MKNHVLFALLIFMISNASAQLNGNYTIGGVSPDYPTFTSAVNALINSGVSGPVVFNIRDGIYQEKVSIPPINNVSAVNTITFQSQSGDSSLVILTDSSSVQPINNFTLHLDSADYITIKSITISRTGSASNCGVILINNGSNHNSFLNNIILGVTVSNTSINASIIYSGGGGAFNDSMNTFSFNLIGNGSYGIYYYGPTLTNLESGTEISNNKFVNNYGRGIQLSNQIDALISGNEIITNSPFNSFYGMSLVSCDSSLLVEKNKISVPRGGDGISISSCNGSPLSPENIINNFIFIGGTANSHGIYLSGCSDINFLYNTIHVSATAVTSCCFTIIGTTNTKIICQNNVLANTGGGYTYYFNGTTPQTLSISNYNDLYSNASNLAYYNNPISNLAAWRIVSGHDLNSVSADPVFASASDLHVFSSLINNAGTPIAGITTDIDGDLRSGSIPDIGADEFIPLSDNLSVSDFIVVSPGGQCGDSSTIIAMTIENIGSVVQSNIPIQVNITGADTITLYDTIPGPLNPDSLIQVTITQNFNSTSGGQYYFGGYSSLGSDQYRSNDSLFLSKSFYAIPNPPNANSPQQVCDNNASITATADSGDVLFWYDQPSGGNLLHIGSPFITTINSDSVFYVESREGRGTTGCIQITECEIGLYDVLEIQNISHYPFDATGWKAIVSSNYSNINTANSLVWDLGYFSPGEIKYKTDQTTAGSQYWGNSIIWDPQNAGWAMIIDPTGRLVDFVVWGWQSSAIQNMSVTAGGFTTSPGQIWNGAGFTPCSAGSITRKGIDDHDTLTDFACDTNSIGSINNNIILVFANCGLGLCGSSRIPVSVNAIQGAHVNIGNDTAIVSPLNCILDAGPGFTSYLWSDGSTTQTFTATQYGAHWVTAVNSNGCTFTDSIIITIPLGIQTSWNPDLVNVYPNPSNDQLNVEIAGSVKADKIALMDAFGRLVYEKVISEHEIVGDLVIDIKLYFPGIYYLYINSYNFSGAIKVIIQHN